MTPIDPVKKRNQKVKVAYMDQLGNVHPSGAKMIWPFVCERKAGWPIDAVAYPVFVTTCIYGENSEAKSKIR